MLGTCLDGLFDVLEYFCKGTIVIQNVFGTETDFKGRGFGLNSR